MGDLYGNHEDKKESVQMNKFVNNTSILRFLMEDIWQPRYIVNMKDYSLI